MKELYKKFKEFAIGEKITLTMETFFGSTTEVKGTYEGNLLQHGYVSNEKYSSWALYPCEKYNIPCYDFHFKPYRNKLNRIISLNDIKNVKKGW